MPMPSGRRGTSLIELTIVIFVIGILCVTAYQYFFGERDDARLAMTKAKAEQIKAAIKQYQVDKGRFPEGLHELKGEYLREFPPRTGWLKEYRLVYDPNPKLLYSTWRGDTEKKCVDEVLDPWKSDLPKGQSTFTPLFNSITADSKILIGKRSVASRVDQVVTDGVDALGRPVYNENLGETIYDASLEIRLKTPDDPETTANDPGYDLTFKITGGRIETCKKDSVPLYPLTPEDQSRVLTELTLEGTSENSVIELDVTGCPFLTQFSMEIFRPAIAGTRIFYGAREVLTIPATEVESYVDPDTGYEVRMRQQLPVRLERFFHESTAVQDVKMKK